MDLGRLLSATAFGQRRRHDERQRQAGVRGQFRGEPCRAWQWRGFKIGMSGGNLSALLIDIAGLEFGNALLSALGIPQRAQLECFAADFPLTRGVLTTRTMILDTSEARVQGTGTINLAAETIDYKVETKSKHFLGRLACDADRHHRCLEEPVDPAGDRPARGARRCGRGAGRAVPPRRRVADDPVRHLGRTSSARPPRRRSARSTPGLDRGPGSAPRGCGGRFSDGS